MKYFLFFLPLLLTACGPDREAIIQGDWQGVLVLEEQDTLPVDPAEIRFRFEPGVYQYHSTLKYREAGSFRIDRQYLITTDTVNQASTEKAVEIIRLDSDTLELRMMENGKERTLLLERI